MFFDKYLFSNSIAECFIVPPPNRNPGDATALEHA